MNTAEEFGENKEPTEANIGGNDSSPESPRDTSSEPKEPSVSENASFPENNTSSEPKEPSVSENASFPENNTSSEPKEPSVSENASFPENNTSSEPKEPSVSENASFPENNTSSEPKEPSVSENASFPENNTSSEPKEPSVSENASFPENNTSSEPKEPSVSENASFPENNTSSEPKEPSVSENASFPENNTSSEPKEPSVSENASFPENNKHPESCSFPFKKILKQIASKEPDNIYYCTHEDNKRPDQFSKFCKQFLKDHHAECTSSGKDKKKIVLVLSIPTENRFDPYGYFKERVKKLVTTCELNTSESPKILLVKISFDGNNRIEQQCVMDERECNEIAKFAKIRFESCIDIYYNKYFEFENYESNIEAANHLKEFYPKTWRFFKTPKD
uniref:Mucin-1-like n=1 Tax=Crassostrea virginica TaxID=6565 RepID=A0A8B8BWQ4_CRAVI|nr:mucin-1-like [Crassostrea virginica]